MSLCEEDRAAAETDLLEFYAC